MSLQRGTDVSATRVPEFRWAYSCTASILNLLNERQISTGEEKRDTPRFPTSCRSSTSVQVVGKRLREIKHDDVLDVFNLNASRCNVRADQDIRHSLPKLLKATQVQEEDHQQRRRAKETAERRQSGSRSVSRALILLHQPSAVALSDSRGRCGSTRLPHSTAREEAWRKRQKDSAPSATTSAFLAP